MIQTAGIMSYSLQVCVDKLSKKTLEYIIEYKRIHLNNLVNLFGELTHPSVIRVSQEIDEYVVQLQKIKLDKH